MTQRERETKTPRRTERTGICPHTGLSREEEHRVHRTRDSKKEEKDESMSKEEGAWYTVHKGPAVHTERKEQGLWGRDKAEQGPQEGQSGTVTRPGHRLC